MILVVLLALPLWQVVSAYLLIGAAWAVLYLPRSITLQAREYRAWRDRRTNGRPLAEVLGCDLKPSKGHIQPGDFLSWCKEKPFSERRILTGFIVNIAFWPLRIVEKLLTDILRSTFVWVFERIADLWTQVIVPFFRWLGRAIDAVWDKLIMPICRTIQRYSRALWYDVLVPIYTWAYRYVVTVYQTIIQRANREAIADLAALNNASQKDPVK